MQTFRDHLRADEDVDLSSAKASERVTIGILARHRISVHSLDGCGRKNLRDGGFDFFRAETGIDERVFAAGRTFFWNRRGVSAQMTTQTRDAAMKRQRDAAIGTIARLAAVAAKQRSGKPAPV